ncbi:hypothetical protein CEXT_783021 [Caerostris extrusa]|uniref:Uncharacterized protein n=1 Tax=Caerostris extrusa TaxID=172846 RepID=A0AAV4R6M0_CAEEX|nr:hypothetical protein CEXT_783021 [Caerostris extrusa]
MVRPRNPGKQARKGSGKIFEERNTVVRHKIFKLLITKGFYLRPSQQTGGNNSFLVFQCGLRGKLNWNANPLPYLPTPECLNRWFIIEIRENRHARAPGKFLGKETPLFVIKYLRS